MKCLRASFGSKSSFSGQGVRAVPELADADLTNAGALAGAVAVVKRGNSDPSSGGVACHQKARRAQHAGAIAVIVVNNEQGYGIGDPDNEAGDITIPAVMVPSSVGAKLVDGVEVKCVAGW